MTTDTMLIRSDHHSIGVAQRRNSNGSDSPQLAWLKAIWLRMETARVRTSERIVITNAAVAASAGHSSPSPRRFGSSRDRSLIAWDITPSPNCVRLDRDAQDASLPRRRASFGTAARSGWLGMGCLRDNTPSLAEPRVDG